VTLHPDAQQFLDVIAGSWRAAYAAALESAGVPVTVARYDDQIHAFFWLVNVMETGDRAVAEAGAAIPDAMAAASA
jgi:acetyl esterase/lipase